MEKRRFVGDSRIMPPVTVHVEMPRGAAIPPPTREQRLIDLMFEIAMSGPGGLYSPEGIAEYTRRRLRAAGFPTEQTESSWGVLVSDH